MSDVIHNLSVEEKISELEGKIDYLEAKLHALESKNPVLEMQHVETPSRSSRDRSTA